MVIGSLAPLSASAQLAPRVRISATEPMIIFARGVRICEAPCELRMAEGPVAISAARPGERPASAGDLVAIRRSDNHLEVARESRAGVRLLGGVMTLVGIAITVASAFVPMLLEDRSAEQWAIGIGASIGVTLISTGVYLAFEPDVSRVERR